MQSGNHAHALSLHSEKVLANMFTDAQRNARVFFLELLNGTLLLETLQIKLKMP